MYSWTTQPMSICLGPYEPKWPPIYLDPWTGRFVPRIFAGWPFPPQAGPFWPRVHFAHGSINKMFQVPKHFFDTEKKLVPWGTKLYSRVSETIDLAGSSSYSNLPSLSMTSLDKFEKPFVYFTLTKLSHINKCKNVERSRALSLLPGCWKIICHHHGREIKGSARHDFTSIV